MPITIEAQITASMRKLLEEAFGKSNPYEFVYTGNRESSQAADPKTLTIAALKETLTELEDEIKALQMPRVFCSSVLKSSLQGRLPKLIAYAGAKATDEDVIILTPADVLTLHERCPLRIRRIISRDDAEYEFVVLGHAPVRLRVPPFEDEGSAL